MTDPQRLACEGDSRLKRSWETVRRAFVEFLGLPSLLIVGFLLLAAGTSALDSARIGWLEPVRTTIRVVLFRAAEATSSLLSTIAGSIITVSSITFSLLLLAVQQAAGALTPVVYDQFLRRRLNQLYFGFFVGLAVYMLLILATVNRPYNPVFDRVVAFLEHRAERSPAVVRAGEVYFLYYDGWSPDGTRHDGLGVAKNPPD